MNKKVIIFGLSTIISLASCSSDPEWADPEAHEKTVQLREQYGLYWERNDGMNHLSLYAGWQDGEYTAFSEDAIFGSADTETLRMRGSRSSICHLKKTTGLPTSVAMPSQISEKECLFSVLTMEVLIPQMAPSIYDQYAPILHSIL
jgi:hypothetical protein